MSTLYIPLVASGYHPNPKRGIGLTLCNPGFPGTGEMLRSLSVSWVYQWWPKIPSWAKHQGVATVGMAAFMKPDMPSQGTDEMMLGFNEPEVGADPLHPADAARAWRVVEQTNPNRKLVSPAVVRDLDWLFEMRQNYHHIYGEWPRFDHLGLHCYPLDGKDVKGYCGPHVDRMTGWLTAWGIPGGLVINEWGSNKVGGAQVREVVDLVHWFESNPAVYRHAMWTLAYRGDEWFAPGWPSRSRCYNCDGVMTDLGRAYATA